MLKKRQQEHPADLAGLLGSKIREEQAQRVQELIGAAKAPVIDLVIRYDGRTSQVTLAAIGGRLAPDVVYFLLEQARAKIRAEEMAALGKVAPGSNGGGEKAEGQAESVHQ